jgi:hypothetical protein
MTAQGRKREIFANPFFAILLGTSALFVLTVLAYLSSTWVLEPNPAGAPRNPSSVAFAEWLDRNAPIVLGAEILAMLGFGVLAMVLDPWFSARSKPTPPK